VAVAAIAFCTLVGCDAAAAATVTLPDAWSEEAEEPALEQAASAHRLRTPQMQRKSIIRMEHLPVTATFVA